MSTVKKIFVMIFFIFGQYFCSTNIYSAEDPETEFPTHNAEEYKKHLDEKNLEGVTPYKTQWEYPRTNGRLVAIGDIHGDFDALFEILFREKIIDREGQWIGGTTQLVQIGDLFDRGTQTKKVIELLMSLEDQAQLAGGQVHVLLGNHETLVAQAVFKYSSIDEMRPFLEHENFKEKLSDEDVQKKFTQLMTTDNPITRWMRNRPAIIKVGETVFAHAGLGEWILKTTPENINATLHYWMSHFHGVAKMEKDPKFGWLIANKEYIGPLWDRSIAQSRLSQETVERILQYVRAEQIVFGHTVNKSKGIDASYNNLAYNIDSAISRAYNGTLSILTQAPNQKKWTPHYYKRPEIGTHYNRLKTRLPGMNNCIYDIIIQVILSE